MRGFSKIGQGASTVAIAYRGDKQAADRLRLRHGVRVMQEFERLTYFQRLTQNERHIYFDDGSWIHLQTRFGDKFATFYAPSPVHKEVTPTKNDAEYYFWIGVCDVWNGPNVGLAYFPLGDFSGGYQILRYADTEETIPVEEEFAAEYRSGLDVFSVYKHHDRGAVVSDIDTNLVANVNDFGTYPGIWDCSSGGETIYAFIDDYHVEYTQETTVYITDKTYSQYSTPLIVYASHAKNKGTTFESVSVPPDDYPEFDDYRRETIYTINSIMDEALYQIAVHNDGLDSGYGGVVEPQHVSWPNLGYGVDPLTVNLTAYAETVIAFNGQAWTIDSGPEYVGPPGSWMYSPLGKGIITPYNYAVSGGVGPYTGSRLFDAPDQLRLLFRIDKADKKQLWFGYTGGDTPNYAVFPYDDPEEVNGVHALEDGLMISRVNAPFGILRKTTEN